MDKKTTGIIAAVLGAFGLILILAGPAFHFIPTQLGIFAALVSWIIAGVVRGIAGKEEKEAKEEEKKEEEREQ